jgi:trk system potassium uptake protein TrkA
MNVVIVGCGRVGSLTAEMLDDGGHNVTLIDWNERSFSRLRDGFRGRTVLGNAIEQDTLKAAQVEEADAFLAATSGDNRNIMTSEIAKAIFGVPKVIARIKDPVRAAIYSELGLEVDCRTLEGADAILQDLGLGGS